MLKFWSIFSEVTEILLWFAIPAIVFFRRSKQGQKNLQARFIASVLATWLATVLHRELIGLPIAMARAEARGNTSYDGVGMNAVLLLFGWIFGLIGSTLVLLFYLAVEYVRRKKKSAA